MRAKPKDPVHLFHRQTALSRLRLLSSQLPFQSPRPSPFKSYPDSQKIQLPKKLPKGDMLVETAIDKRRSERAYTGEPISLEELSSLLHYAAGVTGRVGNFPLRAAPSAGALYPIEIYPIVNNITGLEKGIYHYDPRDHSLEVLDLGDYRSKVAKASLEQDFLSQANVVLALTAVFERTQWKYGARGYRYIYLDAGHIAQNIYLEATSLGLGACDVGAFFDDEVNKLLKIDGVEEFAVLLVSVGKM